MLFSGKEFWGVSAIKLTYLGIQWKTKLSEFATDQNTKPPVQFHQLQAQLWDFKINIWTLGLALLQFKQGEIP